MTIYKSKSFKALLLAATILASPMITMVPGLAFAQASIGISVQIAPPVLPVYVQPPIPAVGYIWTPGYWHWSQQVGYYWVPGTWVLPPQAGVLWTPPYWGWENGVYIFHDGYWGPHVGFYGGVDYGFGYGGIGYQGGRWDGGNFVYNRTANNFGSVHVTNVYQQNVTVINHTHVSYVGGTGGIVATPTADERLAEQDHHLSVTPEQANHIATAAKTPALAASRNKGHPAIVATSRPAQFTGPGVVHARAARVSTSASTRPGPRPAQPGAAARPAAARPAVPPAANRAAARPATARPENPAPNHPEAAAKPPAREPAKTDDDKKVDSDH